MPGASCAVSMERGEFPDAMDGGGLGAEAAGRALKRAKNGVDKLADAVNLKRKFKSLNNFVEKASKTKVGKLLMAFFDYARKFALAWLKSVSANTPPESALGVTLFIVVFVMAWIKGLNAAVAECGSDDLDPTCNSILSILVGVAIETMVTTMTLMLMVVFADVVLIDTLLRPTDIQSMKSFRPSPEASITIRVCIAWLVHPSFLIGLVLCGVMTVVFCYAYMWYLTAQKAPPERKRAAVRHVFLFNLLTLGGVTFMQFWLEHWWRVGKNG